MTRGSLELVAHLSHQPIYTCSGRLYIGKIATSQGGVIGCAARHNPKAIIASITRDKSVVVSELVNGELKQLARHECPKRLTRVLLTSDRVVVSDAFGDVYALPIDESINLREEGAQDEHMILGHFSTVTDIALVEGLIASGDRDNKIRVSRYPFSYVIEAFCLGHEEFVTSLCWWGKRLVSGSGDGCVRMWDRDGNSVGFLKIDNVDIVKKEVTREDVTVGRIVVCPWNSDKMIIGLVDCSAVFEIGSGLTEVKVYRRFEEDVNGMEADDDGTLWVSTVSKIFKVREDGIEEMEFGIEDKEEEGNVECSRFVWLSRQRKKEMVEDWKGKKRRFSELKS